MLEEKKLSLQVSVEPSIWLLVEQAAGEKIVLNLLSNAIKFTTGPGEVRITAKRQDDTIQLQVNDSGVGIAPEDHQAIFDYFVRKGEQSVLGTGIGLALVKELVEAHQGTIEVQSVLGEGSCFTVTLPGAAATSTGQSEDHTDAIQWESAALAEPDIALQQLDTQSSNAANTVLVVEDHPHMAEYVVDVLSHENQFECCWARDGESAFEQAIKLVPDIIVSDVMMPGMDGFALLEALKQNELTSHIPVILLTAKNDDTSRLRGLGMRADDYLTKPFHEKELMLRVSNIIQARDLIHQQLQHKQSAMVNTTAMVEVKLNGREQQFIDKLDGIVSTNYPDVEFIAAQLADPLHITVKQLQRKIKALYGCTPTQYIRNYRLKRAAEFIKQGTDLQDVAHQVGFADYAYFSRAFKAHFDVSPGQY